MKSLQNILEGILDVDFDISEDMFTLDDLGWKVSKFKYINIDFITLTDKLDAKCRDIAGREARTITVDMISDCVSPSFKPTNSNVGWLLNALILYIIKGCRNEEQVKEFISDIMRKNIVSWKWKKNSSQIKVEILFPSFAGGKSSIEFELKNI